MSEASLYRRHRPQSFDQVVGQEHVVRTLSNAIEHDRVHHAYLFVGSRGTGKTSLAKILARSLNCVSGPTLTPCGECESCRTIAAGTSLDVIEMDAASNRSVDDIRDLRDRVGYAPTAGGWKVYILDEAHMLTREAWNAFLKTLEEPPANTVFVLATTEPHKVMPTIVDRCQRFDFQRPSLDQIAEVLRRVAAVEAIEIDDGAVAALARAATGSFRDALGTLDQLVSYGGKKVSTDDVLAVLGVADAELILAATEAIAAGDARAVLAASEQLSAAGHDVSQFARDLLAHLRQLVVLKTVGAIPDGFTVTAAAPERLRAQAEAISELTLGRAIDGLAGALAAIREGDEPRMTVELALLRAARPQLDPSRTALAERLERLEKALAGEAPAVAASRDTADDREAAPAAEPAKKVPGRSEAAGGPAEPAGDASGGEPGPVAQAVAAQALDLERVADLWPAVVERVRDDGAELLAHVLATARPVAVSAEDDRLEIGFPASAAFNKRKAEAAEARDRFAAALEAVVGGRLRPVYTLLDDEAAELEHAVSLSDEEVIDLVVREFDAELVAEPESTEAKAKEAER